MQGSAPVPPPELAREPSPVAQSRCTLRGEGATGDMLGQCVQQLGRDRAGRFQVEQRRALDEPAGQEPGAGILGRRAWKRTRI